ncbi:MAG: hypothetical protein HY088_03090 [Ignavibacteriales bacterium]|nr:hypothetical protein [Ignavibacteriales bacterium]
MKLKAFIITLFLYPVLLLPAFAQQGIPEKLHTTIDKVLDDQFAEIEKALIRNEGMDPKSVLLITVPLENYIEDVLFTINRPAVIYPQTIYKFIRTQFTEGKSRSQIESVLIEMQKYNKFEKLHEAEKQK